MMEQQFIKGTPVYDVDGEKIGTVSEHGIQDNALVVHHGLFREDVYIPLSAIAGSTADGIALTVTKDDVRDERYAAPAGGSTSTTARATSATGDIRVPVYEEEMVVGKQREQIGDVRLHKEVVTEQESIPVALRQEEVTVERVPFTGEASQADLQNAFQDQDIDVPVMGEQAVVSKQAQVVEEVRLHKDTTQQQQQVSDTVRKERVTVEGADEIRGSDAQIDRKP